MPSYRIENTSSGADLGVYQTESPAAALDALARDAGYDDLADMVGIVDGGADDLRAVELPSDEDRLAAWEDGRAAYFADQPCVPPEAETCPDKWRAGWRDAEGEDVGEWAATDGQDDDPEREAEDAEET